MKRLLHTLLSLSLVLAFTATLAPTAHSVIQNVTVVGPGGDPIGRQTVTINFPPGVAMDGKTSAEEDTDDDGLLIFDFPSDGRYRIDFKGGSMMVDVKGGIPTWVKITGGLAALGGILYAVDDNGGGNGNKSGNGGTNNGGTTNGGTTNGGTTNGGTTNGGTTNGGTGNGGNGGNGGDASGEYNTISFVVTSNVANHPESVFAGATYVVTKNLNSDEIDIVVTGGAPGGSANLSGSCDDDGNFTVTGPGTFAGFPTTYSMNGTFNISGGTVSFTISSGNDGGLPMGEPIVGDGTAEK